MEKAKRRAGSIIMLNLSGQPRNKKIKKHKLNLN